MLAPNIFDKGASPSTNHSTLVVLWIPLLSLDASVIDLSATMFDWAKFRLTKGAVKLHLLPDHDGYLPSYAVITEGKKHEVRVARQMRFAPGTILVFDRGYTDYEWFASLMQQGGYFVTRLKENADYAVVERYFAVDTRGAVPSCLSRDWPESWAQMGRAIRKRVPKSKGTAELRLIGATSSSALRLVNCMTIKRKKQVRCD